VLVARGLAFVSVLAVLGLIIASQASDLTSIARPEFAALRAPESLIPTARGVVKGDPEARFSILTFGDYQCPACAWFADRVQPRVDSAFVDTGRAKFVFFDLPLGSVHANAFLAARAAHCAEDQARFWEYQDELYRTQASWASLPTPHDAFEEVAGTVGLDGVAFRSCLDSDRHASVVEANQELARTLGIRSTPTIVISLENGTTREVNKNSFAAIVQTLEEMDSATPTN
jgi:protein-disulfide isomerase